MQSSQTGVHDKKEITIAGVKGIEYIPTENSINYGDTGQGVGINLYFANGDTLYNIHMTWPTGSDYGQDKQGFGMIVNTTKFQ